MNAWKKAFSLFKKVKASLAISILVLAAYFAFSQGSLFIEKALMMWLSFSFSRPLSIILYMFAHTSPWHAMANALAVFFFAALVENRLSGKDVFAIFFFSGAFTAVLFTLLNPAFSLVGASAGAIGLLASALILDLKKSAIVLGVAAAAYLALFSGISFAVEENEKTLVSAAQQLEMDLNKAIASNNRERASVLKAEVSAARQKVSSFRESREMASGIDIDPFLHSYAAIAGIAYLLLFRKKEALDAVKRQKGNGWLGFREKI